MITFGDDAFDALFTVAQHIPHGYTVALMSDATSDLDSGDDAWVPGQHVCLIGVNAEGVLYVDIDPKTGEADKGARAKLRPWVSIARIHVY